MTSNELLRILLIYFLMKISDFNVSTPNLFCKSDNDRERVCVFTYVWII